MAVINLGEEEQIYRNIAYEALKDVFGKEDADKLIDADDVEIEGLDMDAEDAE